ncbi:hypothetical protein FGIG_05269 [Fasciola gigantica]|uniref:Uncharacterized protein n=1 Tax=Fasciola gigantica TaxID=46835 RepID=A0A504YHJ5_FASGI|nr:hypothetical protein FGIG_05269 [Fasciola gigantica]
MIQNENVSNSEPGSEDASFLTNSKLDKLNLHGHIDCHGSVARILNLHRGEQMNTHLTYWIIDFILPGISGYDLWL